MTPPTVARGGDREGAQRPSQLGRSTHTLTAILRVNATSLPSCHAKSSRRSAPPLDCTTKGAFLYRVTIDMRQHSMDDAGGEYPPTQNLYIYKALYV